MNERKFIKKILPGLAAACLTAVCGCENAVGTAGSQIQADRTYFQKPAYTATSFRVIDRASLSAAERPMIAALQGIVANKTSTQIYITDSTMRDGEYQDGDAYLIWLNDLRDRHGIGYTEAASAAALVDEYKEYIDGYILYQSGNSSINVASSLAGILNAIPVAKNIELDISAYGLREVLDASDKDEAWCKENYWDQFSHDVIIEQKEENDLCLRDFAAMRKSMVFFDDTPDSPFRTSIMASMNDDAALMGWGQVIGSENRFIMNSSQNGVHYLPLDWGKNLSVLSGFDSSRSYIQKTQGEPAYEENVHYVAFIVSDGDNIQWTLGRGNEKRWWGSDARGDFDVGWTFPPALMELAPTVLKWYYDTASTNDNFVIGPSGSGFFFPGAYPAAELELGLERLNDFMGRLDINSVVLLGYNDWDDTKMLSRDTSQENIDALFYFEWYDFGLNTHGRQIKWLNGKLIISCGEKLFERKKECLGNINKASTDVYSDGAYTVVYAHAWEPNIMDSIKYVVDNLNQNVRVVTPAAMIKIVNHFYNPQL